MDFGLTKIKDNRPKRTQMTKPPPTSVPVLTTDTQAEDFLAQDLSTLDPTQFKPTRFDSPPKPAQTPNTRKNP